MIDKSETLCKNCGKETYNKSKEWSGYCSPKCERRDNKKKTSIQKKGGK